MQAKPITISPQRLARFITWARCVVLWLMAVFAGRAAPIARRFGLFDVDTLTHAVEDLIFLHATELCLFRPRARRSFRAPPPRGFRRGFSTTRRCFIGAHLRRRLKRGAGGERLFVLLDALNTIDALATRLARRLHRGLTRLRALIVCAPPAARVSSQARVLVAFSNSS